MNHPPILFMGMLAAMAVSWFGMILVPASHIGAQQPVPAQVTGELYPQARSGMAEQGRDVYRKLGCVSCHTQQVRPIQADLARFGPKPTVTQDFLFDRPALIGTIRVGPDLSNVGLRLPDAKWHLRHLYDPRSAIPGSTMPPSPFLFDKVASDNGRSDSLTVGPGVIVVPKHEANALVAYLLSLRADAHLFERPAPQPPPKPPGADDASASVTNAPAK